MQGVEGYAVGSTITVISIPIPYMLGAFGVAGIGGLQFHQI